MKLASSDCVIVTESGVVQILFTLNTFTSPVLRLLLLSPPKAPTAILCTLALIPTEQPKLSFASSPSMSSSTCVHVVPTKSKTLTCPEELPFPSFRTAPTTILVPRSFMETDPPN